MEFLHNKKIGIWGLGITGKSLIKYLRQLPCTLSATDKRVLKEEENDFLALHNLCFMTNLEEFLEYNDIIFPSSGVDIQPYSSYTQKFFTELDLFSLLWNKPVIAITGSLGKTTVTSLLSAALKEQELSIATGGNIGVPLLELISHNNVDYGVIELSSFQLERSYNFKPQLALITNLYPNHLDRHKTFENYFQAKSNIIHYQRPDQHALVPLILAPLLRNQEWAHDRSFNFFSEKKPSEKEYIQITNRDTLFYLQGHTIIKEGSTTTTIINDCNLPTSSYSSNWLMVYITLYLLNQKLKIPQHYALPEHRLEYLGTYNTFSFYNDSKATVMESTLAAVDKLAGTTIILFLGGFSKGVDRTSYIHALKNKVHTIICFGTEAQSLANMCKQAGINHYAFEKLNQAFEYAVSHASPHSTLLLSPGGASYDLFKDYEERGNYFKNLITTKFS